MEGSARVAALFLSISCLSACAVQVDSDATDKVEPQCADWQRPAPPNHWTECLTEPFGLWNVSVLEANVPNYIADQDVLDAPDSYVRYNRLRMEWRNQEVGFVTVATEVNRTDIQIDDATPEWAEGPLVENVPAYELFGIPVCFGAGGEWYGYSNEANFELMEENTWWPDAELGTLDLNEHGMTIHADGVVERAFALFPDDIYAPPVDTDFTVTLRLEYVGQPTRRHAPTCVPWF